MEHYSAQLDTIFQALADPTRRAVLGQLGRGPASVGDLAGPFDMALPSFMKHIHFLEGCGLIATHKHGRVRMCSLQQQQFQAIDNWLRDQRELWERRTDQLEQFVTTNQDKEKSK